MPSTRPNLFTRDDTMFGICQGLGEDLGFNPNYLRIALPLPLFLFPVPTIVGYFAAGVVVFAVRSLMPNRMVCKAAGLAEVETTRPSAIADEQPLQLAA